MLSKFFGGKFEEVAFLEIEIFFEILAYNNVLNFKNMRYFFILKKITA